MTIQNTWNTINVAVDFNMNYLSVFVKEHFISAHYGVEFRAQAAELQVAFHLWGHTGVWGRLRAGLQARWINAIL